MHTLHLYGFKPVCDLSCLILCSALEKPFAQKEQMNLFWNVVGGVELLGIACLLACLVWMVGVGGQRRREDQWTRAKVVEVFIIRCSGM